MTYQLTTMHRTSLNTSNGQWANAPGLGTWAVEDVVTVDHLPAGAVFGSASDGRVYDAASNTVTWPAWSDG